MTKLPSYSDNPSRLAALSRYRDLDYSSDSEFQTITELAAGYCDATISVITLVDENEVNFIFTHGIKGISCVPRDNAFCEKTVFQGGSLNIPDTLLDPEFKNSPLVVNEPYIRFYAGLPLITYDGHAIGTLCVLDTQPKILSDSQINSITQLSKIAAKLFESKLLESISRTNESFVQAIDEIVYEHDTLTKKIKWLGAYTRILGFNETEMGSNEDSWLEKVHPDDLTSVLKEYEKVKKGHQLYDLEYRFAQRNGNFIWVHDRGVMHFDKNGHPIQTIGVIRDIHKRKLTELALQERESRFSSLVNNAIVCIHEIDLEGHFTSMNPSGLKMLGLDNEKQIKGTSYLDGVAEKDYNRIKFLLEKSLLGENATFEFTGTSGQVYSSCFVPIKNQKGNVTKLMGISEDITERVKSEIKHKQLQNELNHFSRLSNMDEMATGLAHEINQPLTAISNYCDAALSLLTSEESTNPKLLDLLQGATEQAHRAGEIVRHCRQFASKQPIEKHIIDLNELTHETVRFLDSDARDNNIEIQITLDKNLPAVKVDKVQIQQVLVNLIRNGIEAMQNNNVRTRKLSVYTHLNGDNSKSREAQITIKDTGPGFELSQIDNLFKPFYTTKKNGMGMGLSISHTIISAHGGKLWLDRRDSKNTKFHFTLPIEAQ